MERHMKAVEYNKMIQKHKTNLCVASESRDFIEAYLKVLLKVQEDPDTTFSGEKVICM